MSVTVNNSLIQCYANADDGIPPTEEMTPGFKPLTMCMELNSKMRRESMIILPRFLGVYTGSLCAMELFLKYCY